MKKEESKVIGTTTREHERWARVPIHDYGDLYDVSDYGRVYSRRTRRMLSPKVSRAGYARVTLCNGKRNHRTFSVHKLVALAFVENPENKATVNHKNEDKLDNHYSNLEWMTVAENNAHGTRTERAIAHTNWKARKIDYHSVAAKHNYASPTMCGRKQTEVFRDGKSIGVFYSQREAAMFLSISVSRLSACISQGKEVHGCIAVTKKHFGEE